MIIAELPFIRLGIGHGNGATGTTGATDATGYTGAAGTGVYRGVEKPARYLS